MNYFTHSLCGWLCTRCFFIYKKHTYWLQPGRFLIFHDLSLKFLNCFLNFLVLARVFLLLSSRVTVYYDIKCEAETFRYRNTLIRIEVCIVKRLA